MTAVGCAMRLIPRFTPSGTRRRRGCYLLSVARIIADGAIGIAAGVYEFRRSTDTVIALCVLWTPKRKAFSYNRNGIGQWGLFSRCGRSENQVTYVLST